MSSLIRSIQRAVSRGKYFNGRGTKLGYTNPKGADKLAREAREAREAKK